MTQIFNAEPKTHFGIVTYCEVLFLLLPFVLYEG